MTSVVSGSALAAVSSSQLLTALNSAAHADSPVGDVVGKITVGYQGWFACKGAANSGMLALDEDGTACSADYYLRLTGDGGRMLRGQIALAATRPTRPTIGGGGDGQAPTVPGNLAVTAKTATTVTLSWSASTDNVGVAGYQVLRGGTVVATAPNTPYTVTGLTPATAYSFTVVARDAAGNTSGASNAVNVTTSASSTPVIVLRSRANDRYVSAAGGSPLVANGTSAGAAQQFERVDLGNGNVGLRARVNNRFVCAEGAGAQPLVANRDAIGPWEQFDLVAG